MFERLLLQLCVLFLFWAPCAYGIEDPTRPPSKAQPVTTVAVAAPKLDSILHGPERRLAMINGRVMLEGQRIGGIVLEEVETNEVVIRTGGKRMRLSLTGKNIIKEEK